jgi:hypothetical protein
VTINSRLARVNAAVVSVTRGMGEAAIVDLSTGSCEAPVAFFREPNVIGATGAWETIPVASCRASDLPGTPGQGDRITEASGHRWIIDRADLTDGLWRMTLRADPRT